MQNAKRKMQNANAQANTEIEARKPSPKKHNKLYGGGYNAANGYNRKYHSGIFF